jgi:hypothetical protein
VCCDLVLPPLGSMQKMKRRGSGKESVVFTQKASRGRTELRDASYCRWRMYAQSYVLVDGRSRIVCLRPVRWPFRFLDYLVRWSTP